MSTRVEGDKVHRVHFILDGLNRGRSSEDIEADLRREQEREREALRKGMENEILVMEKIQDLPEIARVYPVKVGSSGYTLRDLVARFAWDQLYHNEQIALLGCLPVLDRVGIQVKSSRQGIVNFESRYGSTPQEVSAGLATDRLVVINASLPEAVIVSSFRNQVRLINAYWTNGNSHHHHRRGY